MLRDQKGFASGFIALLATIFIMLVVYVAFDPAYQALYNIAAQSNNQQLLEVLGYINTAYVKFPLILLIGMIVYAIVSALRREPNTYRL